MFETLNIGSSFCLMLNGDIHRFMHYFLEFGACINGFANMRKVIAIDVTHLHLNTRHVVERCWTIYGELCLFNCLFCH